MKTGLIEIPLLHYGPVFLSSARIEPDSRAYASTLRAFPVSQCNSAAAEHYQYSPPDNHKNLPSVGSRTYTDGFL